MKNFIKFGNFGGTIGFLHVFQKAKYLGYLPGLTYQSIPFDFRLAMENKNNALTKTLKANLSRLKNLSSKKVMIIAQSFGNNGVALELTRMEKTFKEETIAGWIALTPPFRGGVRSLLGVTGGNNAFSIWDWLGIRFVSSVRLMRTFPGVYQLFPRPNLLSKQGDLWIDWVRRRYNTLNTIHAFDISK